ncbi:hypothetical protein GCM10018784_62380 [Streptomyces hydrogenans]|nr:hypothetical protein GCM10018784_62380 [Streptomyces hydrogenans]
MGRICSVPCWCGSGSAEDAAGRDRASEGAGDAYGGRQPAKRGVAEDGFDDAVPRSARTAPSARYVCWWSPVVPPTSP